MDLSLHVEAPHVSVFSPPSSAFRPMDSERCPPPIDLHRGERFLSRLSSFHLVKSRSSSWKSVAGQHDPSLRRSSSQFLGRCSRLSFGHVPPRSPFDRSDVVRSLALPSPRRRGQTNLVFIEGTRTSLWRDRKPSLPLALIDDIDCIQAGSSLCLLVILSHPLLRRPSYEVFLRTHQALAVLSAYSIWRHLPSDSLFPRMYIYISAGLFLSTSVVEYVRVLWRNGTFQHGHARALVTHADGSVKVSITLSRPLKVEAGQNINLWIPSVSFWSFLQSHPFVVASWSHEAQDRLELFVEPRRGLTRDLLYHAQTAEKGATFRSRRVMFSGPHGVSAPVGEYESVFMIATGFGMAALFPYLKKLIHCYQTRKVCTRQIRVIWQMQRIGKHAQGQVYVDRKLTNAETALVMQPLLNDALKGDNLDKVACDRCFYGRG
jgi:hypothetical protein